MLVKINYGDQETFIRDIEDYKEKPSEEAKKHLMRMGFSDDQITVKYTEKKKGVAKEILDEVTSGGYGTVVLGRKGASNLAGMLFGSVSGAVIGNLVGATICIVE